MRKLAAAWLVAFSCAAFAQPLESEVKAAFLFKFLSFVEWPAGALRDPGTPIVIGMIGAEEVATALEQVSAGRTVQGRALQVRRLQPGESVEGLQMLFLSRGSSSQLREIGRAAPVEPVLIVCEWQGALEQGAVVNFVTREGRVRFEVALDAAEHRSLRISPRMLAVALNVRGAKP